MARHIDTSDTGKGLITYSQINEAKAKSAIREQVSFFESIRQAFEWKVYDYDQPSDLKERLRSSGFTVEEAEAIMVLDLEDAPEIFWQPVLHNVQQIIDPLKISGCPIR